MDSGVAIPAGNRAQSAYSNLIADPRWQGVLILATILGLSATLWLVPLTSGQAQAVIHNLYFIPLIIAGRLFGWRKSILFTLFVMMIETPHFFRQSANYPVRAIDNFAELATFGVAAIIIGYLTDREKRQREHLEATTRKLEEVYGELRQNVDKLKKAERLSAAGQLSAGLAHEIRNPLASIAGAAGILKRGYGTGEDERDCLDIIDKESHRLNQLLTSFLEFARPRTPRFQSTDLGAVIDSVCTLAAHQAGPNSVELTRVIDGNLPEIQCDPEQIKQVLLNLVLNAIQASPACATVQVSAHRQDDAVIVDVIDEGRGIPDELQSQIFEPFFTTKEHGTGLGLAVAAKIVDQHAGTLTALDNVKRGTTVRVSLPVVQETLK